MKWKSFEEMIWATMCEKKWSRKDQQPETGKQRKSFFREEGVQTAESESRMWRG